ncbi:MAG: hypothetical protein AB8H80_04285 [Planctomycetota bacterium]
MIRLNISWRSTLSVLLLAAPTLAQVDWSQAAAINAPFPFGGSCWDSVRNRLVAFGGEVAGTESSSMREWDGSQWVNVGVQPRPGARTRPAMAFDEARGVTVLFAGSTASSNDTWTYDGTAWTQQTPANQPPVRQGSALAYDKRRQVVVMFGGFTPSGQDSDDLWEWDGTDWSPVLTAVRPPPRGAHRMVYDEGMGQVLMCGGYNTQLLSTLNDTWTWDGAVWTPGGNLPGTLCDQALAYEPTRQRVVLFGGLRIQGGTLTDLGDVLEYDGTWFSRSTPSSGPSDRSSAAVGYDTVTGDILVSGGVAGPNSLGDTWRYELTQPATGSTFGLPCAVTQGADLEVLGLPYLGTAFEQSIVNASATAGVGLIIFGGSNTTSAGAPLPFDLSSIGAPGCSLNVSLDVANTVLLNNGTGSFVWNLPNIPAAVGSPFYTQGVVLDPASPLPFQIDMTSGRAFTIGNP